jgi:hypothetical protein
MKPEKQLCPYCKKKKRDVNRHIRLAHPAEWKAFYKKPAENTLAPTNISNAEPLPAAPEPNPSAELPKVKKRYTRRLKWMVLFGIVGTFGLILTVILFTGKDNLILGYFAIPLLFVGAIGIWYHKGKFDEIQTTHIGDVPRKQVNSLVIYPDRIEFQDIVGAKGFTWNWEQDNHKYYLYWEDPKDKVLKPYNLPDQQYCDPEVFGQKFLSLPCHRAWISVKEDIIQKLKWVFVAVIGVGVWILILTTT